MHLGPRQKALLMGGLFCIGVLLIGAAYASRHSSLTVSLNDRSMEADGASTALLEIRGTARELQSLTVTSIDTSRLQVESMASARGRTIVGLRAGVLPGEARVCMRSGSGATREVSLRLTPDLSDSYGDGTPDFLRLSDDTDVDSFRRWFTFLAESQYFLQPRIPAEVHDCASLLSFAYREALRRHDGAWAAALSLPRLPAIPEIKQYNYPHTPLGASLFRTRPGPFTSGDLQGGAFAEFADADSLRRFNTYFVSRRIQDARTGDLLFFRQDSQNSPFHAMILLERSALDGTAEPLLVYDTGAIAGGPGEIRRPTLQELLRYPDARWRPLPENRAFLGVYRWNILRGAN